MNPRQMPKTESTKFQITANASLRPHFARIARGCARGNQIQNANESNFSQCRNQQNQLINPPNFRQGQIQQADSTFVIILAQMQ